MVNWIAADILRIQDGILVEHWDVIQDEATEQESERKTPMFGDTFQHDTSYSVTNPVARANVVSDFVQGSPRSSATNPALPAHGHP
jgi:hypothetical protein